jgi:hypothetical protein
MIMCGHRAALLLALSSSLLAGCAKDVDPGPPPDLVRGTPTPAWDPQPVYPNVALSPGLDRMLVLVASEGPAVAASDGVTPLRVRVPLRSTADDDLLVQYRFFFYGPGKEPLTENPVWHAATIPARQRQWFTANALSLRANDWDLEVRVYRP